MPRIRCYLIDLEVIWFQLLQSFRNSLHFIYAPNISTSNQTFRHCLLHKHIRDSSHYIINLAFSFCWQHSPWRRNICNRPKCLLLLRVYSFQLHGQSIPPIIEYHGYPCTLLSLRLGWNLCIEINGGSFRLKGYEHVIVINTDVTCFVKRIIWHWDARYADLVWINQQMVHKLPNHKTSLNTKIQVLLNSSLYAVRHIAICTSGIG